MGSQCSCHAGFLGGQHRSNAFRKGQRKQVATPSEAMALVDRSIASRCGGKTWASPVPYFSPSGPGDTILDLDDNLHRPDVLASCRKGKTQLNPLTKKSKFEIEQMFASPGSLPKPMQKHEREQRIRELLPNATRELMSNIPPELVRARSEEGQLLRRKLAAGSTVVFFSAGYAGKRFSFEYCQAVGIRTVVVDNPDSWARSLVADGVIAKFIPIDMSQSSDEVYKETLGAIKTLGSDGLTGEVDAVCTLVELAVPMVARLCEGLGLPGPSPQAVDAARDKHATRAVLKNAGLPAPRNCLIKSANDLDHAGEVVGFPAVLKPVSGAASLGVKKVESKEELLECYREVIDELSSLVVVSGALQQKEQGSNEGVSAESLVCLDILFEQYLDGQEVDVDIVMSEGDWQYVGVSDNGPTIEPYFNETWGCCPSLLPLEKQRELKDLGVASVVALGFDSGVFHVELKYTSTGPQLIEVNARMGGGPVYEVNKRVWGVDLVEEAIFCALGIPSRPCVSEKPRCATAYYFVPAETSGVVREVPTRELEGTNGVVWARELVQPGDVVTGPADGMATWVGMLLVEGEDVSKTLDKVIAMKEQYHVQTVPSDES